MIRSILCVLLLAVSAPAYTNRAVVSSPFVVLSSSTELRQALNVMSDVKDDFSGPNMFVGSPDDKPTMSPGGLARVAPAVTEAPSGKMVAATKTEKADDSPAPVKTRKYRWVTAVFWSQIDLYGHTIATKY